MNRATAYIIFFSLFLPSLILSFGNYSITKERIIDDVNQALAKTIQGNIGVEITADTLRIFKGYLNVEQLKETSYLALCTDEPSRSPFCSDTMSFIAGDEKCLIRAYPNCSRAAIFGMSEQTMPSVLFGLSMLWGLFSFIYFNRKNRIAYAGVSDSSILEFGTLSFSKSENCFYNDRNERISFTSMQFQLMKLLITSDGHRLSVDEICSKLWPGKEDARDTLYTLVRRIKPVIESNTNIRIKAEKGHYYALHVAE